MLISGLEINFARSLTSFEVTVPVSSTAGRNLTTENRIKMKSKKFFYDYFKIKMVRKTNTGFSPHILIIRLVKLSLFLLIVKK